jgi:DNA-directed RNA polymerase specialized sigma24 family protein
MNKTEGAIKSLQYRALGAMRRGLEEMWEMNDATRP